MAWGAQTRARAGDDDVLCQSDANRRSIHSGLPPHGPDRASSTQTGTPMPDRKPVGCGGSPWVVRCVKPLCQTSGVTGNAYCRCPEAISDRATQERSPRHARAGPLSDAPVALHSTERNDCHGQPCQQPGVEAQDKRDRTRRSKVSKEYLGVGVGPLHPDTSGHRRIV